MPIGPILGGLGVVLGTDLLGRWLSGSDREEQERLQQEAMAIYGDASPPTLERMLQERLGPSAMEALPEDFGNRNPRNLALQELTRMGLAGGMDPGSQLALEQARRAGAQASAQGQAAVRQDFQRRGLGGAAEATMALQAQQAGADRTALADMQAAADARARALQALATGGSMAAQAEGQDFDRAARIAQSKDAIARFNAELATGAIQQDWSNRLGLMDRRYGATLAGAGQAGDRAADAMRRAGAYGQFAGDALFGPMGPWGKPSPSGGDPQGGAPPAAPPPAPYNKNDPRYRKPRGPDDTRP